MVNRKGQVSIEYLILTGFIVLAIIIPSIIFLYSVTNNSVHGKITHQKTVDLGQGLVNDAKQVYYLGLYSNKVVEYDVPRNVQNMYVVEITKDSNKYYYFGLVLADGKTTAKFTFQSDIPIIAQSDKGHVSNLAPDPNPIDECSGNCKFYTFVEPIKNAGKKKFKIETILDEDDNEIKSVIIPVVD